MLVIKISINTGTCFCFLIQNSICHLTNSITRSAQSIVGTSQTTIMARFTQFRLLVDVVLFGAFTFSRGFVWNQELRDVTVFAIGVCNPFYVHEASWA